MIQSKQMLEILMFVYRNVLWQISWFTSTVILQHQEAAVLGVQQFLQVVWVFPLQPEKSTKNHRVMSSQSVKLFLSLCDVLRHFSHKLEPGGKKYKSPKASWSFWLFLILCWAAIPHVQLLYSSVRWKQEQLNSWPDGLCSVCDASQERERVKMSKTHE